MSKKMISVNNVSEGQIAKASRKRDQSGAFDVALTRECATMLRQAMEAMDAALGKYLIWTPTVFDLAKSRMDDKELKRVLKFLDRHSAFLALHLAELKKAAGLDEDEGM